jgi:hypothetical protein
MVVLPLWRIRSPSGCLSTETDVLFCPAIKLCEQGPDFDLRTNLSLI